MVLLNTKTYVTGKSAYSKKSFLSSQPKHMLWPCGYPKEQSQNMLFYHNFTHIFFSNLDQYVNVNMLIGTLSPVMSHTL